MTTAVVRPGQRTVRYHEGIHRLTLKAALMPLDTRWYNEDHKIIYTRCIGTWTTQEVEAANAKVRDMLDSVTYKVHGIVDLRQLALIPATYKLDVDQMVTNLHPNSGLIVIMGHPLAEELFRLYCLHVGGVNHDYGFADTVLQARRMIQRYERGQLVSSTPLGSAGLN